MRLAEEALRSGRAAGKAYNIVDDGPAVGAHSFWNPLIEGYFHLIIFFTWIYYFFKYFQIIQ